MVQRIDRIRSVQQVIVNGSLTKTTGEKMKKIKGSAEDVL